MLFQSNNSEKEAKPTAGVKIQQKGLCWTMLNVKHHVYQAIILRQHLPFNEIASVQRMCKTGKRRREDSAEHTEIIFK